MANNAAAFQPGQSPGAEPSMEEILASIRRIIADDSLGTKKDETPASAPLPPPPPRAPVAPAATVAVEAMEADPDSDVLDLAEVGTLAGPESDDMMIGLAEDVIKDDPPVDMEDPEIEAWPPVPEPLAAPMAVMTPPPPPAPPAPSRPAAALSDPIISVETSGMVSNAFAHLARNTPMPAPGRSLEDIVAEMLRPMLREWMDSHLPGIVERLVRAEIERVARSG
jgi:uncharacterized protein